MKLFQNPNVTRLMESHHPFSREVLHEDLQILRYTLAAILDDVRTLSPRSADAVERAIQDLDRARRDLNDDQKNQSAKDRPSSPYPGKRSDEHGAGVFSAGCRPSYFR